MPFLAGKQNIVLKKPVFQTENTANIVKGKANSVSIASKKKVSTNPERENKISEKKLMIHYLLNEGTGTSINDTGKLNLDLSSQVSSWDTSSFSKTVYELSSTGNKFLTIASTLANNSKKLRNLFKRSFTISYWLKYDASQTGTIFSLYESNSNHLYTQV